MNNLVRMRSGVPAPGTRSGNWVWDGQQWQCCDFDFDVDDCPGVVPPFPGCPPPGWPPRGCPPWFSGQNSPPWYPGANAGVSFGQTAPLNPVRGHFWWDGHTLWMFDGAAWVSTGGVAAGTPPQTTPPANPVPGQQWFDGKTLWVWDGNAWIPVSQTKTFIQASAPPAPNAGDLWWDGTQMHIWDGSAWELVGPGATVGPVPTTTQTFAMMTSVNIALGAAATWTIIPFLATPTIDTQSAWNATTHQLTPKKAGNYLFGITGWTGGTADSCSLTLVKNDTGAYNANSQVNVAMAGISGANDYLWANGLVHMNGTTDFVRMWAYGSGSNYYPLFASPPLTAWLFP
jgi:hypothetical protein